MVDKLQLAADFIDSHPTAAARVLEEQIPDAASAIVDVVDDGLSVKALSNMAPSHAARCIERLSAESAGKYLRALTPQQAAAILRHTAVSTREAILKHLPGAARIRIVAILRHRRSTVGSWMETRVLALPVGIKVQHALSRIKRDESVVDTMIYAVDDRHRLAGTIPTAKLLRASDATPLSQLIEPLSFRLRSNAGIDTAIRNPGWETVDQLPVVDRDDRFVGVIRFAALRRAVADAVANEPGSPVATNLLDLANVWYVGLADLMNISIGNSSSGDPRTQ